MSKFNNKCTSAVADNAVTINGVPSSVQQNDRNKLTSSSQIHSLLGRRRTDPISYDERALPSTSDKKLLSTRQNETNTLTPLALQIVTTALLSRVYPEQREDNTSVKQNNNTPTFAPSQDGFTAAPLSLISLDSDNETDFYRSFTMKVA